MPRRVWSGRFCRSAAWRSTGGRSSSLGACSSPRPASGCFLEHRGREVMRFTPVEDVAAGEWRIDAELPDTPEGREAAALVQSGQRKGLSVEFFALAEKRVSQVREVRSAFVEATALCREGCYAQSTVELRSTSVKAWL